MQAAQLFKVKNCIQAKELQRWYLVRTAKHSVVKKQEPKAQERIQKRNRPKNQTYKKNITRNRQHSLVQLSWCTNSTWVSKESQRNLSSPLNIWLNAGVTLCKRLLLAYWCSCAASNHRRCMIVTWCGMLVLGQKRLAIEDLTLVQALAAVTLLLLTFACAAAASSFLRLWSEINAKNVFVVQAGWSIKWETAHIQAAREIRDNRPPLSPSGAALWLRTLVGLSTAFFSSFPAVPLLDISTTQATPGAECNIAINNKMDVNFQRFGRSVVCSRDLEHACNYFFLQFP